MGDLIHYEDKSLMMRLNKAIDKYDSDNADCIVDEILSNEKNIESEMPDDFLENIKNKCNERKKLKTYRKIICAITSGIIVSTAIAGAYRYNSLIQNTNNDVYIENDTNQDNDNMQESIPKEYNDPKENYSNIEFAYIDSIPMYNFDDGTNWHVPGDNSNTITNKYVENTFKDALDRCLFSDIFTDEFKEKFSLIDDKAYAFIDENDKGCINKVLNAKLKNNNGGVFKIILEYVDNNKNSIRITQLENTNKKTYTSKYCLNYYINDVIDDEEHIIAAASAGKYNIYLELINMNEEEIKEVLDEIDLLQ